MDPRRYVTEEVKIEKDNVTARAKQAREAREREKRLRLAATRI
jgi:hypothetical protein